MNILELEVWNIRGIPHILLQPDGKNLVVCGQNGSGKSAIVDAIDFLLTGHISRLIGEGTGDISLSKHGPHILHKPEEAIVRAKISLPFIENPVEIKRCIGSQSEVEINCEQKDKILVEFALDSARSGNYVLTRREILKYIYTEPKERAERIEAILNISEIGEIRSTLVTVRNKAREDYRTNKALLQSTEGAVNSTIGKTTLSVDDVQEFVNSNRAILDGKAIDRINSNQIQLGLRKPADYAPVQGVNISLVDKDIEKLRNVFLISNQDEVARKDKTLREAIADIRKDPVVSRAVSRLRLFETGKELIDEDGNCPLCDASWEHDKLAEYLDNKIEKVHGFNEKNKLINKLSSDILERLNVVSASLQALVRTLEKVEVETHKFVLQSWYVKLEELISALCIPLNKYPDEKFNIDSVKVIGAPAGIEDILTIIGGILHQKVPEATPELNAWTVLTRLGENLKALEDSKIKFERAALYKKRAETLHDKFISSRNKVVGKLYDTIRGRFVELYKSLHSSDEGGFQAKLEPAGAGLDFEVDFYGQGSHPPHALHSEGHQDSMGICLYLALAERLNANIINLVILDDVVMSVDAEHRKQVCGLLATSFPKRQFIITTHDRYWANQLKAAGVVQSKRLIEFYNWSIGGGPQVSYDTIIWDEITECLAKNDIPGAAHKLRWGLESFFREASGSLRAEIEYNTSHRWDLGDFLPAAIRQYRTLLKRAKKSANSWDKQELVDQLTKTEELSGKIISRTNAEQWAVNASVHYNTWGENCVKEDFIPVVEAYRNLCSLFECSHCGELLEISSADGDIVGVGCGCGEETWNLKIKGE